MIFITEKIRYAIYRILGLVLIFAMSISISYAASVVLTDGGPTWQQWGSTSNWTVYGSGGYNNSSFRWTLNSQFSYSERGRWWSTINTSCSAKAYIPGSGAATRSAKYYLNSGSSYYHVSTTDQYYALGWTNIMPLVTCSVPSIYLSDATGEPANTTSVFYDEIQLNY